MPLLYSDLARSFDQREHKKIELHMKAEELEYALEMQELVAKGHDESSAEAVAKMQHTQMEEKIRGELLQEIREEVMQNIEAERVAILNQAQAQAESEIESAKASGYDAGYTEGFAQGIEKGRQQAFDEAQDECNIIKGEAELVREQAKAVLEEANKRALLRADKEQGEIIDLAVTIAGKIVNAEISENKELIVRIAEEACREFKKRKSVILHVHPDHTALLEASVTAFSKICPNAEFVILPDEAVEQNSCIIESDNTVVDAQITSQLENIRQALHRIAGDDDE